MNGSRGGKDRAENREEKGYSVKWRKAQEERFQKPQ